ncbi:MAG: hypothetical protein HY401_05225 [Elusimicrobia bacterium]|nr:hypothetical protein [Elusimicrobiota bacterium]
MTEEKKKVAIILVLGVSLFGTLTWWIINPLVTHGPKLGDDAPDVASFSDELARAQKATEEEEHYLDTVNQPTELVTDASDMGSLGLIKKDAMGGKKDDTSSKLDDKKDYPPKVDTLDRIRSLMKDKLQRLGGGSLFGLSGGGGGSSGGTGFSPGDLDKYRSRFGADSNFKGGNVLTGPGAASKTRLGGRGTRGAKDSTFGGKGKEDQLASAAAGKFGESKDGKGTGDGRGGLRDAAEGIPADLKGNDSSGPLNPDIPQTPEKPEKDYCKLVKPYNRDKAMVSIFAGAGMLLLGGILGGGKNMDQVLGQAFKMAEPGIMALVYPNEPIDQCYANAGRAPASGSQGSGQQGGGQK